MTTMCKTSSVRKWAVTIAATAAVAALSPLAVSRPAAPKPRYTLTKIGHFASAVNNKRQVAGMDRDKGAFVWEDGKRKYLGGAREPGSLGVGSQATGINDQGQIIGEFNTPEGRHACLWSGGKRTDLGTIGGDYNSTATDINNKGRVVGYGDKRLFLWENGKIQDLGNLGSDSLGEARAINGSGQVVGGSPTRRGDHQAFLWEKGRMISLGTLPGNESHAQDINDKGQIVGGLHRAWLWEKGKMTHLGSLPGTTSSQAKAINNRGQVVGTSEHRAFLWEKDKIYDLNALVSAPPGLVLDEAMDINDHGQIVCLSNQGAFLLTPQ